MAVNILSDIQKNKVTEAHSGNDGVISHPAFKHLRSQRIDTLDVTVREFEHIKTGAMHFHMEADHQENVFMVALRTVPMDSKGVAHVLEHTALCGSEKYPVRDPFFLMLRRSLNTFMNAFTSSDYTAYPFATQNVKDFNNLLDIYLDAVFFPNLDKLDFAQEGHRLEFEEMQNPDSALVHKGVVYNEMKGDSSSVVSLLYDEVKTHLYPTSTYHYNSGGDPKHIANLTYDELVDFYKSHYHPSNAIFMTFGNMNHVDLQHAMEERALCKFDRSSDFIAVTPEQRLTSTLRVSEPYPTDDKDNLQGKTHIVMAWLLGDSIDLALLLRCNLLSDVLLDTAASPLRKALESTGLGAAPSPLCGLEESNREMSFLCGLQGSDEFRADEVEALILTTLAEVAEQGVEIGALEACLHQLELSHREIGGDGTPFGMQLIFSCMSAAIHRGDPIDLLDIDKVIAQLRVEIKDPNFIKNLIKEVLLDNNHRVRVCLYPDAQMNNRNRLEEETNLQQIKDRLSDTEKQAIVTQSIDLETRQNREEPIELLPKVGIEDIPASLPEPKPRIVAAGHKHLAQFDAGTNGLVYNHIVSQMPALDADSMRLLPLFTHLLTESGSADRGYLEAQALQHSLTGGISAFSTVRGTVSDPESLVGHISVSSKALNRNASSMMSLLKQTYEQPNFTETARTRDLVKQARVRRDSSITNSGHMLAMTAASSVLRPVPRLNHYLSGLEGILHLRHLDDGLDDADNLARLTDQLQKIGEAMRDTKTQFLMINDPLVADEMQHALADIWSTISPSVETGLLETSFAAPEFRQAWITTTQVNYCARAFKTVPENHRDSAALTILGGVLRNGYLHRTIREQGGAYGGGASHDSTNGIFRFYSYRDPRLQATFDDFSAAVDWVMTTPVTFSDVEQSILGVVSSIDSPASPAGEARQVFYNDLFGRDEVYRQQRRSDLLNVTVEDVRRVATAYLTGEPVDVVVTNERNARDLAAGYVDHIL
jgi:Zn-dependent M16 (insulinase) family peptidase|tara:strand:- start:5666 stop:8644 length:2979 start_codon:yes stop_codon:yes gene_type:complete